MMQICAARVNQRIPLDKGVFYFEVEVLECGREG